VQILRLHGEHPADDLGGRGELAALDALSREAQPVDVERPRHRAGPSSLSAIPPS